MPPKLFVACGLFVAFVVVVIVLSGLPRELVSVVTGKPRASTVRSAAGPATYVGAVTCKKCHDDEFKTWTGSHHELAMQPANEKTVLGNFNDAAFDYFGIESLFFKKDGKFMVRTDGPNGALADYEVAFTFGVFPLQQYLVGLPGGRYQALHLAWDSRPKDAGGQRWFHLYPNERIPHDDQLHWTGLYQNWNLMCAECHSTNLRKGYDASTNSYKTTFSEINVACESCHGPGSRHVDWARYSRPPYPRGTDRGLEVALNSEWATAWRFESPDAKFPIRDKPAPAAALNNCAPCHARRSTLAEGVKPGSPLEDSHRLALLTDPLYHTDGQQRDEVYVWGSFLQSKMYQKGVTCMDCHDPHSLKIRAEGNAVCARCHSPEKFDTPKHHFHKADGSGAKCTACHMPTQKYMVVHDRLDHSIRVPRPDLTPATGAPDACTMCHADQKPEWAAAAMDAWYPPTWRSRPQWGPTLAAGITQGAKAVPSLMALAQEASMPAIVRATAATVAAGGMRPEYSSVAQTLTTDSDPNVRLAGIGLLERFEPSFRANAAAGLLSDPVRGVRIEAARLLADVPSGSLNAAQSEARERALLEYQAALRLNADWPAENVNAGDLALRRGRPEEAIVAFRRAIALDPRFAAAYVNISDVYRGMNREPEGEQTLREGLKVLPRSADLHHALGLLLVRTGKKAEALTELELGASLAPTVVRYSYVYAIGLHSAGRASDGIDRLRDIDAKHPFDPEVVGALVSMLQERDGPGDRAEALKYAKRLGEAMPHDPGVKQLVNELSGGR
ncbi:MAG: hypothetical protein JSR77_05860 [Planctomycetes bacterium]|nr:hypothetical protein [Planctomycetota bacterium]